jgi:hypothetical protein
MSTIELDEWDYQLICIFKRCNAYEEIARAKKLWSKRNMIDEKLMHISYPLERALKIYELMREQNKSDVTDTYSLIEQASPAKDWLYKGYTFSDDRPTYYWERMFVAIALILRHTESKYFPGFDDYFNNVWLKEGNP